MVICYRKKWWLIKKKGYNMVKRSQNFENLELWVKGGIPLKELRQISMLE